MKKLKPNTNILGLVPAIFSLLVLALVSILFGIDYGFKTLGVIIAIYSFLLGFWFYVKTRNSYFLVVFFYMLCFSFFLFSIDVRLLDGNFGLTAAAKFFFALMIFFGLWLLYLVTSKKIKWRGREIMEIAAKEVEPGEGSFTERPKPFAKIDIDQNQLAGFANFLNKNLIFLVTVEENGITLIPLKEGKEYYLLFGDPALTESTWVKIGLDGNITVNISQQDYLDFKYDLSFDQLTNSLGKLVTRFSELFQKGQEVRIMDEINSVKIGYFS